MKTLHFSITINAPREKVWNTMLDDKTYRQWTQAFNPAGSWFEGDWSKGSQILFLGPDPKDSKIIGGMISKIEENKPNEFVSIKHIGEVSNGVHDTTSEKVKAWGEAFENYTFTDQDGGTLVSVELTGLPDDFVPYMESMWPEALKKLKEISENNA